jgi:hypothetical protein
MWKGNEAIRRQLKRRYVLSSPHMTQFGTQIVFTGGGNINAINETTARNEKTRREKAVVLEA